MGLIESTKEKTQMKAEICVRLLQHGCFETMYCTSFCEGFDFHASWETLHVTNACGAFWDGGTGATRWPKRFQKSNMQIIVLSTDLQRNAHGIKQSILGILL